jgi:RNA polymerase-binding transcription factor DksA
MPRDVALIRDRLVSLVDEVLGHYGALDASHLSIGDQKNLGDLVDAFDRLDAGTYGTCVSCGIYLGPERLLEAPTQSLCTGCEVEDAWRPFGPR